MWNFHPGRGSKIRHKKQINKSYSVFAGDQCFGRKERAAAMKGVGKAGVLGEAQVAGSDRMVREDLIRKRRLEQDWQEVRGYIGR